MRALFKWLLARAVANDRLWSMLDSTLLQAARFAEWERQKSRIHVSDAERVAELRRIFPDLTVRHGPFAGMRYPAAHAPTGRLFPKLIGSYERELHAVLENVCRRPYSEIVNIGCGEGYYAVGLARRMPAVRVFAFDTDPMALQQCREMAELNDVAERVITATRLDAASLRNFSFTSRGLVLSDCEGYELELFTDEAVHALARHDALIEVHDFVNLQISRTLRERFAATHELQVVSSIDDIKRAQTYEYEELADLDLPTRKRLLAEERQWTMEWFFLTSRGQAG